MEHIEEHQFSGSFLVVEFCVSNHSWESPTIAGMVESISSVADVWKTLAGIYSGARSVMMMVEVEEQMDATA